MTKTPAAHLLGQGPRAYRVAMDPMKARAWLVAALMYLGLAVVAVEAVQMPSQEQAWEGQGEETSYAFALDGGKYRVGWVSGCATSVELWRTPSDLDQVLDGPGVYTIPAGEWFWSVVADCPWRITLNPT
jgi:hypothetical protein